jgi:hypothetical protein
VFVALLVGFAPLVVFCLFAHLSLHLALWLAFATAFSFAIRAFLDTGRLRLFDTANTVLFGLLALYVAFIQPGLELSWVGLILEIGLLVMALGSVATRRPFTTEYAVALILPEHWRAPRFLRANYWLSWVWVATFAAMAFADSMNLFLHTVAPNLATGTGLVALAGALIYTWQRGIRIGGRFGRSP